MFFNLFFILIEETNIPHQLNGSQSYANESFPRYNNLPHQGQPAPYENDNLNNSHHEYSELSFSGRYDYPYFPPTEPITVQPGRVHPMEFVRIAYFFYKKNQSLWQNITHFRIYTFRK